MGLHLVEVIADLPRAFVGQLRRHVRAEGCRQPTVLRGAACAAVLSGRSGGVLSGQSGGVAQVAAVPAHLGGWCHFAALVVLGAHVLAAHTPRMNLPGAHLPGLLDLVAARL